MSLFNIFGRASGVLRYFLLVAFLSEANFALITYAFKFGSLARAFIDGGLDNLLTRDCARNYDRLSSYGFNGLVIKFILSLIFLGSGFFYLHDARDMSRYQIGVVYAAACGSMLLSFAGIIRSGFTAIERMEYVFYTNLPARALSILLLFGALYLALPLYYAALAVSFENALWLVLLWVMSLRFFTLSPVNFSLRHIYFMVRESLPLAVYSFFTIFYLSLDVLMIEYIMGDPKYVAPYGYASLLIEGINMLLTGYIIAVYPTFSRLFEQNEAAYQRLFRMSFNLLLAATIPASVLLSFWSYGWMNFIRETGDLSGNILQVLTLNLSLNMLNTLLIMVYTSRNQQGWLVLFASTTLIISFVSNWFLIRWFGQLGAAWATFLSQLTMLIIMGISARRMFALHYPWQKPGRMLLVSLLAGGLTWLIPHLYLLLVPFVYGGLLLFFIWLFRIVTAEEWQEWRKALRKESVEDSLE
jgi:O-antigen/teichoic acid export membrane protein